MIKLRHPIGDHQRMMVRKRHNSGAEPDVNGQLRRGGDEHLGTSYDLDAARMMLSDPCLVISQAVQMHQQLHVARQSLRGILDHRVIWGEEYAQSQTLLHFADLLKES